MITIILGIIIGVLITFLIVQERNIIKLTKDLKEHQQKDTNTLLHTSSINPNFRNLIQVINSHQKEIKNKEIAIQRQNNRLKKMIINISHDLKTPLTSAIGYVDILKSSKLDKEKQQKYLTITKERLQKLSTLIHSFFEFSKVMSSDNEIELEQIDISRILEQCIISYYEDFEKNNRQIILKKNLSKNLIWSNKTMLIRIFDNLIGNSLKHSDSDLTISLKYTKDQFILSFKNKITDTDLDVDQIFDEFYTTDISRTKGNTGLGLAIVKEFVTLLGGTVSAKKRQGFLTITITFLEKKKS